VNSVGAAFQRHFNGVVDHEGDVVPGGLSLQALGFRQKSIPLQGLLPDLEEGGAVGKHTLHILGKGASVQPGAVGDRVQQQGGADLILGKLHSGLLLSIGFR